MMDFKKSYLDNVNYNSTYGEFNALTKQWGSQIPKAEWPLEMGEIIYVDSDDYTCSVITDSGKTLPRVSLLSPWFSFSSGAGMYVMPEANSKVTVGRLSNGQWVVIGFPPLHNKDDEYSMKNGRRSLQEGDICVSTDYGNYIEIRKNAGYIALHNNHICEFILNSKENQAYLATQRLKVENSAGSIDMTVNDDTGDTVTVGMFRMNIADEKNFVKIMAGSVGAVNGDYYSIDPASGNLTSPKVIFSINVCNNFSLTIDTDGNLKTYSNSQEHLVESDHEIEANGVIRDMSAANIEHLKGPGRALSGLIDAGMQQLSSYTPGKVNQVVPPPPNEYNQPLPPPGGGNAVVGQAPDIDPDANPAPPPEEGGHIVVKKYAEWNPKVGRYGNKCIMSIYNDIGEIIGSYQCINGPWGAGKIPLGNYTVSNLRRRSSPVGMTVLDQSDNTLYGWSCDISNVYDKRVGRTRSLLRIHPDGNSIGTNGCFGIVGPVDIQRDCYNKLKTTLSENNGRCILEYIE